MKEKNRHSATWSYTVYSLKKSPLAIIGFLCITIVVIMATFSPLIATHDPYCLDMKNALQPPSKEHLFGTDAVGRDLFSRVVYGSRIALTIGLVVVTVSTIAGSTIGALSGYLGGVTDMIVMRIVELFLAIPPLIFAMVVTAALGPSIYNIMLGLSLTWWTWHSRIVRGEVLRIKELNFIMVERAMGASMARIVIRHLIPNAAGPILVQSTVQLGLAILAAAGLSFLGMGAQPPMPSWGLMIAQGRRYLPIYWWLCTFPGIGIFILVVGFLLVGDNLRDVLAREAK